MKKNRIRICGRKTSTPPTPAITPCTSRLLSQGQAPVCGSAACTQPPSAVVAALMASIGATAQLNTAWKTRNSTSASSSGPASGCSTTASMRSLGVCGTRASRPRRCRMACTRSASGVSWCPGGAAAGQCARSAINSRSAASPPERTPTVATTGVPSSAASAAASTGRPARSARSAMFSATTTGRPWRCTASTSLRLRRRLVASTTQTTRSGRFSPTARPASTSQVTRSSGERGCRL